MIQSYLKENLKFLIYKLLSIKLNIKIMINIGPFFKKKTPP